MRTTRLKIRGLYDDPDPISDAPSGAMHTASNVVFDRPGLAEPRPTLDIVEAGGTAHPTAISNYRPVWMRVFDGDRFTVSRSGSTYKLYNWTSDQEVQDGASASIGFTEGEIDAFEAAGALFFTSDDGVRKLADGTDTDAYLAGVPRALQASAELPNESTGFLGVSDAVAYRVLFGRWDGNRKIVGPPSGRTFVGREGTGTSDDVDLTIPIPDGVRAGDFLEIYRSEVITVGTPANADEQPGDELYMRVSIKITADHITAGEVTWRDTDDTEQGASLYTNETQEGALQANERPHIATCASWFNGMAFYGGHQTRPGLTASMSSYYVTVSGGNVDHQWPLVQYGPVGLGTITCTLGSALVTYTTDGNAEAVLRVGQYICDVGNADPTTATTHFAASTKISAIDFSTRTITLTKTAIASGNPSNVSVWDWVQVDGVDFIPCFHSSALPATNFFYPRLEYNATAALKLYQFSMQDLCRAINENASVGAYASCTGFGKGEHTLTIWPDTETGAAVTVKSTGKDFFDKDLDSATGITLASDGGQSRLAWSKQDQPEAVPILHYQDIGSEGKAILALKRTRDSLFIFKEDGTWRLTGDTPEQIRIDEFDLTLRLVHPNAACEAGGQIIAWTTRGIVSVSDAGVTELSPMLLRSTFRDRVNVIHTSAAPRNYASVAAWHDPLARRAYFTIGQDVGETYAGDLYVLSLVTGSWGKWTLNTNGWSAGCYDATTTQSLFGAKVTGVAQVREESLTDTGYDDSYSVTVNDVTGSTVTIAGGSGWTPAVGDVLTVGSWVAWITSIDSATVFDVSTQSGTAGTGAGTGYSCYSADLAWTPDSGGDPAVRKHWRDLTLICEQYTTQPPASVAFYADTDSSSATPSIEMGAYGTSTANRYFRGSVARNVARCGRLGITLSLKGTGTWALNGIAVSFEPEGDRF